MNVMSVLESVFFPRICLLCGVVVPEKGRLLCPFCLKETFEDPNPYHFSSCNGIILPENIEFQDALWEFDKGGKLQELLHALKYGGLSRLGKEIGFMLGQRLLEHPIFVHRDIKRYILVPVPLHPLKLRQRGYNQARAISEGVSQKTGIDVINYCNVMRSRFTPSQTGFTLNKRIENVRNAFKVTERQAVYGRKIIIIDDVFTTGATSFELASVCTEAGAASVAILTVAQA